VNPDEETRANLYFIGNMFLLSLLGGILAAAGVLLIGQFH
jgi:hypothetical protein